MSVHIRTYRIVRFDHDYRRRWAVVDEQWLDPDVWEVLAVFDSRTECAAWIRNVQARQAALGDS